MLTAFSFVDTERVLQKLSDSGLISSVLRLMDDQDPNVQEKVSAIVAMLSADGMPHIVLCVCECACLLCLCLSVCGCVFACACLFVHVACQMPLH